MYGPSVLALLVALSMKPFWLTLVENDLFSKFL